MKLSVVEYGSGINLVDFFPQSDSLINITNILENANSIIKKALGTKKDTLVVSNGNHLRALGIAGTIRLSKDLELEIVPKILNDDTEDWKESLFLLAALSKYGSIITSEHIHSSTNYKDSLYDIAGRILAREYLNNKRKLIRQYRREHFYDFSIDGDIDFETVFEKNPNGIPQTKVTFDRINPFNSTIQTAMHIVLPYIKDSSTRQIISKAILELGKQYYKSQNRLRIPSRNREWSKIYNLSFDICAGMGSSFENGEIMSPSFIVDTWRIWEWLITIALKIGLDSRYNSISQAKTAWGIKNTRDKSFRVNVIPDVIIYNCKDNNTPAFLVDAKYKVFPEKESFEIERSDLYEAFAFCHATGVNKIFLAYPAEPNNSYIPGSISLVATYKIEDISISVIKVAFCSITKQGDITSFCRRMASDILTIALDK